MRGLGNKVRDEEIRMYSIACYSLTEVSCQTRSYVLAGLLAMQTKENIDEEYCFIHSLGLTTFPL